MRNTRRFPRSARRGSVTVVVLVCLIVVTLICGALLKVGLTERKVVRTEEDRLQAEWLVEAGLERGASRLKTGTDYTGETWTISAEDLGGPDPGLVTIVVETPTDHPDQRALKVRAEYPAGSAQAVRQSKRLVLKPRAADRGDDRTGLVPDYRGRSPVPSTMMMVVVHRPIEKATGPDGRSGLSSR
jgi:Tfp pilus assembly protein PilX